MAVKYHRELKTKVNDSCKAIYYLCRCFIVIVQYKQVLVLQENTAADGYGEWSRQHASSSW